MTEMTFYHKHYITVDEGGRVVNGFSTAFHQPQETDICINEKGGYQFRLFPDGRMNPTLIEENGIPLYRWDGEAVVLRSDDEIEQDKAALPTPTPTTEQRLTEMEQQLIATDEIAVELYEQQLAQEEINIAQDEALCELYEMMGV